MPTLSTSSRPQSLPKGQARGPSPGQPAHAKAPAARTGQLQQKLKRANYSEGRQLLKPDQPMAVSAGPRGVAADAHQAHDPGSGNQPPAQSQLTAAQQQGQQAFAAQLAKGDKMHAATLSGVAAPASMGKGSFTLATGSAVSNTVHDAWSMTTEFLVQQQLDPTASREELLARAAALDPARGGTLMSNRLSQGREMSDPVQSGGAQPPIDNTRVERPARLGKRRAVVVGNSDYVDQHAPAGFSAEFEDLPGAQADAAAMAADLKDRGFEVERHQNLDAAAMRQALVGRGRDLIAGDELAVVYTGHGIKAGLAGTDAMRSLDTLKITDVLPHSELAGEARQAVSRGYHLELVVDACESDALASATRKDLEANGAQTVSKNLIDNGYLRLPVDERADALNRVLRQKGYAPSSLDDFAQILEKNTELVNR